jgi:hypothetical protein
MNKDSGSDARKRDERDEEDSPFFSCAFCSETSEKPFRICESCGSAQPEASEEE